MLIATFSGVRFVCDDNSQSICRKYTSAFSRHINSILDQQIKDGISDANKVNRKLVIVGRDGRSSGEQFVSQVIDTLLENGFQVQYIGIVPTPTVQQIVQLHNAIGGVILTASHNPGEWCGLKFVSPSSIFLTPAECEIVYGDLRDEKPLDPRPIESINDSNLTIIDNQVALREHFDQIAKSDLVDVQAIKDAKITVAFNAQNASGAEYLDIIEKNLGINIIRFNTKVGELPAHPEPTPANLQDFEVHLKGKKFDIGFAVDPDADRCVLINELGVPILEELTLALCNQYVQEQQPQKNFVRNCSTSLVNDDICNKFNCKCTETAVGEVNVALKMRELGARIGGEGNGGVILADAHLGRDSLVAVMLSLSALAKERKTNSNAKISTLIDRLPVFVMLKRKREFKTEDRQKLQNALSNLQTKGIEGARISTVDGVKFIFDTLQQWVHARFSNTEPVLRVITEARNADIANNLAAMIENAVFE